MGVEFGTIVPMIVGLANPSFDTSRRPKEITHVLFVVEVESDTRLDLPLGVLHPILTNVGAVASTFVAILTLGRR